MNNDKWWRERKGGGGKDERNNLNKLGLGKGLVGGRGRIKLKAMVVGMQLQLAPIVSSLLL